MSSRVITGTPGLLMLLLGLAGAIFPGCENTGPEANTTQAQPQEESKASPQSRTRSPEPSAQAKADPAQQEPVQFPEVEYGPNNVARIVRWGQLYKLMGMTPQWAAQAPEGDDGWETPGLLDTFLQGPMADVEEVVFAIRRAGGDWHWYANFGYAANDPRYFLHGEGAQLVKMNLRTRETTVLLDDPQGDIRDPFVDYDGKTILLSYRPGGTNYFHLYTISAEGENLTQLTDGPYDDIEPIYMPNGDIAFCSSRCRRWVPCWKSQVAITYRCKPDGSNIHPISVNVETENTPWMLPDGRVLYTRWEYVDRDQNLSYHHLWTFNPDGTGVMTYFGNLFSGLLLIDAKPVPGTDKVVCTAAPGHGRNEHAGAVTLVSPDKGPDELSSCRIVSRPEPDLEPYGWHKDEHRWRDPWAFSEDCFLAARMRDLCVMDGQGRYETIYSLSEDWPRTGNKRVFMVHEPRPLIRRERELSIPDRTDSAQGEGTFVLADANMGRNMEGVEPGLVKKLLVLEVLPKPINYFGGADQNAAWPTYFLYRVLGTVPVEEDGSAHFNVPAKRPVFFVSLDENDLSVKRMQSFTSVMPGETISCVGCHENRTQSPSNPRQMQLMALDRSPSALRPVPDTPEIFDYPRDIQPILDRHCIECHNFEKFSGRVALTGDRGLGYSISYDMLHKTGQVVVRSPVGNYPPRGLGSGASPLPAKLKPSHHNVKTSREERRKVRTWIDAGAAYSGTYASLGRGMVYYKNPPIDLLQNRCGDCHAGKPGRRDKHGLKNFLRTGHYVNLTRPEKSLMLLAPLSKEAGGLGLCRETKAGKSFDQDNPLTRAEVFASKDDPDYQKLLGSIQNVSKWMINDVTSFEFDTFMPSPGYFRELKRYGILEESFDPQTDPFDPYQLDEQYWQLFWHRPGQK